MTLKIFSCTSYLLVCGLLGGELEKSFQDLGSEKFAARELAHRRLEDWSRKRPQQAVKRLLSEYRRSESPEVQQRLLMLLERQVIFNKFGRPKGFVGIEMQYAQIDRQGQRIPVVKVGYVFPGSPADKNGIVLGDLIWQLDGKSFSDKKDVTLQFQERVAKKHAGDQVLIGLYRGGEPMEIKLTLMSRTGDLPDADVDHRVRLLRRERAERERAHKKYLEQWLDTHLGAKET